jgi:glycosyltransferase involved in cell wall biosynthesis
MTEPRPLVSIVVPFHNEEEGVERFYESLCSAVRQVADVDFEVVFVDDGSRDETLQRLIALVTAIRASAPSSSRAISARRRRSVPESIWQPATRSFRSMPICRIRRS